MNSMLPLLCLGALTFLEQDLDLERLHRMTLSVDWNYRRADFNGDGQADLLLPAEVRFQQNGGFPPESRAVPPGAQDHAQADVFGSVLYVRHPNRLSLHRWENGAWQTIQEQAIVWPSPEPPGDDTQWDWNEYSARLALARFLADIDGDGVPEIALPGTDGLHIYHKGAAEYAEVSRLDVFPPLRVPWFLSARMWPPEARALEYPRRTRSFRYALEGNRLMVVYPDSSSSPQKTRFTVRYYSIDAAQDFAAVVDPAANEMSAELSGRPTPFRMNPEAPLDYVLIDESMSRASALPISLTDTMASTDGGQTFQSLRSKERAVSGPCVDFNHDGRTDLATWSHDFFDAGLRESVNRVLSGTQLTEEVRIHYQDAQGGFSKTPDVTGRFEIRIDKPPVRGGHHMGSDACNVRGDFDADGRNDAAVMTQPGRIDIFPCRDAGFSATALGTVRVEGAGQMSFGVEDVDGDGRPDIIVQWWLENTQSPGRKVQRKVYLSRETAP